MKKLDIKIGDKFGLLTIISELGKNKHGRRLFKCKCDCGKDVARSLQYLTTAIKPNCHCLRGVTHGMSRTRIYSIHKGIKQRCRNTNCSIYYKYGEKGIDVCDEWYNSFEAFKDWAFANGYDDKLTIDRIDNNKGYFPENCRWADYTTQNTNMSLLKTNKSGYAGISLANKGKKYVCVISVNNKSKRIGSYNTKKEAVEARNKFIDDNNLPHKKNVYTGEKI